MAKKKNLWMEILSSIFLSALFISFVNIGVSYFYPEPEYNDFIDCVIQPDGTCTGEDCVQLSDRWTCSNQDRDLYLEESNKYSQNIFYIFMVFGLIGVGLGLFVPNLIAQITGISTGFILAIEGIIRNRDSTLTIFISVGILIGIVIYMLYKFQKKK